MIPLDASMSRAYAHRFGATGLTFYDDDVEWFSRPTPRARAANAGRAGGRQPALAQSRAVIGRSRPGSGGSTGEHIVDRAQPQLERRELRVPPPERITKLRLLEHHQRRADGHGEHVDLIARSCRDVGERRMERVLRLLLRLELHEDVRMTRRSPVDEEPRLELRNLDDLCHPLSKRLLGRG